MIDAIVTMCEGEEWRHAADVLVASVRKHWKGDHKRRCPNIYVYSDQPVPGQRHVGDLRRIMPKIETNCQRAIHKLAIWTLEELGDTILYLDADQFAIGDLSWLHDVEPFSAPLDGGAAEPQEIEGLPCINAGCMVLHPDKATYSAMCTMAMLEPPPGNWKHSDQDIITTYHNRNQLVKSFIPPHRYMSPRSIYRPPMWEINYPITSLIHFMGEHKPWKPCPDQKFAEIWKRWADVEASL